MNLPTRWNPFRQISRLDPFTDLDDLIRGFGASSLAREYERTLDMRLEVNEDDATYFVNVDMPGVKKSDIDVSVEGNQVTITAEVKREKSSDKEKQLYNERYTGKTFRSFSLPAPVDAGKCQATYDGGVLALTLPKKSEGGSKHLSIN